ncbi:hypothetical protein [Aquitalea magnusonii]|uniref:Uncharacterized protein n=1 Tax=Aquitalea magnusonii TaxID=332411 RepID=A0A318JF48_9NEIS|nr:hypothetical protein [Aquitalea magnusonii]PXX45943.1 hypothetical protein DFR38_11041 [Aquitalea magnusonii]
MHQQTEELIEILQEAIEGLTDRDIVDMDLCQIGLAFFPRMRRAVASPCFVNGTWHVDSEIRTGWQALYGVGYPVYGLQVLTLLDNEMISQAIEAPRQTIDDDAWLRKTAAVIRRELSRSLHHAVNRLLDDITTH